MEEFKKSLCKCKTQDEYKSCFKKAKPEDIQGLADFLCKVLKKQVPLGTKKKLIVLQNCRALRHLVHPSYSVKSKKRYLQKGRGVGESIGSILKETAKIGVKAGKTVGKTLKTAGINDGC